MHLLRKWIMLISIVTMMVLIGLAGFTSLSKAQGGGTTTRVSVASDGTQGNSNSYDSSISADGRYVAFYSYASTLVGKDTNAVGDVFVHDRQTGQTSRVSIASDGTQGNGRSLYPDISADGRYVAFHSLSNNLVSNDTNGRDDIFVHDRETEQTSRVSIASDGTQSNNESYLSAISADGRYVVFISDSTNLVSADTNNVTDVFVHDRQMGQTSRVSIASDGTQGNNISYAPAISADGRYVAFHSAANNLVSDDTNSKEDVFVHDRETGQTNRVSISSDGTQGNDSSLFPALSADGQYVAFQSLASNLISNNTNGVYDVFIHDRQTAQTSLVSIALDGTQGNNASYAPAISADKRYVTFYSLAYNLVSNDTNSAADIFVYDYHTGQTEIISVSSNGTQSNANSDAASISSDGRYVAFSTHATNLVTNDTNGFQDVFVRDRGEQPTSTPTVTNTAAPSATSTPTPTSPPGATLTPTSLPSTTPIVTNTPPPGATFTPTSTYTRTPTVTNTPSPSATSTPTQPASDGEVFVPLVLRQHAFATPAPTPTPTVTNTPSPICEILDHEPNNLYIDSDNNLPLCVGSVVNGVVSRATDVNDIYRIEVEGGGGTIQVALTNLPNGADYDLYLDAGPGNNLAFSTNPGSANEMITFTVAPGRYYIRVVAREDGNPNGYQLRWIRQ